jgi:hypothetical protein
MKKMNYEAPKAEVIELSVNKDFMQTLGPGPGMSITSASSY